MHKHLNTIGFAAFGAALALASVPALAQESMPAEAASAQRAAPQAEAAPRAKPADKEAAIAAWPAETQEYYNSLTPARQKLFWSLTDTDKVKLSQLPEPQRESTWAQIESRAKPPQG
jgi:hypothetical protein